MKCETIAGFIQEDAVQNSFEKWALFRKEKKNKINTRPLSGNIFKPVVILKCSITIS